MVLNKEEQLFFRHLADLSNTAFIREIPIFSDFLSVRETAILKSHIADLPTGRFFLFGGCKEAERLMVCFCPFFLKEEEISFPIDVLKISVKGQKFVQKLPKHSDFLGAILGTGIDRRLIGDIYIEENGSCAYLFCVKTITDFLLHNLCCVGSLKVNCEFSSFREVKASRKTTEFFCTVASLRVDVILSEVFKLSRTKVKELFVSDKVILNGSLESSPHKNIKEGDVLSARGFGKFVFLEILGTSKKNKIKIKIEKYS